MDIKLSELLELGFVKTHTCKRTPNGTLKFERLADAPRSMLSNFEPMVYLWVTSSSEGSFEALYVGKAGLGVARRLKQHEGGFKTSSPGKKNFSEICTLLDKGKELFVFARKAGYVEILGVRINAYSVEEEAIHDRYAPLWNRAIFAAGLNKKGAKEGGKAPEVAKVQREQEQPAIFLESNANSLDFSEVLRGAMISEFYEGLDDANSTLFYRLLGWALSLDAARGLPMKVVLGYEDQPQGYNKVATILISPLGRKGRALPNAWVVRIPLHADDEFPLTVTLPLMYKSSQVSESSISRGKGENYRPLDLERFLNDPGRYTTLV